MPNSVLPTNQSWITTTCICAGPEGRAGTAGPPVYLSNAHFCDTDPIVAETVSNLRCKPDKHVTFIDVEPLTGTTLRAAKRIQMSTEYGPGNLDSTVNKSVQRYMHTDSSRFAHRTLLLKRIKLLSISLLAQAKI